MDLAATDVDAAIAFLAKQGVDDAENLRTPHVETAEEQGKILGDTVPAGLVIEESN